MLAPILSLIGLALLMVLARYMAVQAHQSQAVEATLYALGQYGGIAVAVVPFCYLAWRLSTIGMH